MAKEENGNSSGSELVLVTPKLALGWLKRSEQLQGPQRKTQSQRVSAYVGKMRRGEWMLTPTAVIGISHEGHIVDGKHRLTAVVSSGLTIPMWVVLNAPLRTFQVLDQNLIRTQTQIAQMKGLRWCGSSHIGAANMALLNPLAPFKSKPSKMSLRDLEFFMDRYEQPLSLAFPTYRGSSTFPNAPFRGAILRALISRPHQQNKIANFLKATICDSEDTSGRMAMASTLAKAILSYRSLGVSERARATVYKASCKAIETYLDGTPGSKSRWISTVSSLQRVVMNMEPDTKQSRSYAMFPTEFDGWDPERESANTYFSRISDKAA